MSGGIESEKNYVEEKFSELLNGSFSLIQLYTDDVRIEYIHHPFLVAEKTVKKMFHEQEVQYINAYSNTWLSSHDAISHF
jgi:hypothetical protein